MTLVEPGVPRLRRPCWIGLDLGTSACRAIAIDKDAHELARESVPLPTPRSVQNGGVEQEPDVWWGATEAVLRRLTDALPGFRSAGICVAATSATVLLARPDGTPIGAALMYNDRRAASQARQVAAVAPLASPARGPTASLAKVLHLKAVRAPCDEILALHQADWISGRLSGRFGVTDWNNALKLGFDAASGVWPDWIQELDLEPMRLPDVVAPGTHLGEIPACVSESTGLAAGTRVIAGTTDSTAAVMAAGLIVPGEALTCLGSTLVVKILSERPVNDPKRGVYSHRFGDLWLVGGASNSGGAVLRQFFNDVEVERLSSALRPEEATGLDYYPLPQPGERFPIHDPDLEPKIGPRPADDARFLQALLEGIARIEAVGYEVLRHLGAPSPSAVTTIGGGAANAAWTQIRRRLLGLPVRAALHQEGAYGAALLAMRERQPPI